MPEQTALDNVRYWARKKRDDRAGYGKPVICPNGHELTREWLLAGENRVPRDDCRTCRRVASYYDREQLID